MSHLTKEDTFTLLCAVSELTHASGRGATGRALSEIALKLTEGVGLADDADSPPAEAAPRPSTVMVCLNEAHMHHCKLAFGKDSYHYVLIGGSLMGRKFEKAIIFQHWEKPMLHAEVQEHQRWVDEQLRTKLPPSIHPIYV